MAENSTILGSESVKKRDEDSDDGSTYENYKMKLFDQDLYSLLLPVLGNRKGRRVTRSSLF